MSSGSLHVEHVAGSGAHLMCQRLLHTLLAFFLGRENGGKSNTLQRGNQEDMRNTHSVPTPGEVRQSSKLRWEAWYPEVAPGRPESKLASIARCLASCFAPASAAAP